jgi:hypothetical protein
MRLQDNTRHVGQTQIRHFNLRTGAKALYLTVSTVKSTWRRWYVNEICNTDHGWGDNDKTFVLGVNRGSLSRMSTTNPTRTGS